MKHNIVTKTLPLVVTAVLGACSLLPRGEIPVEATQITKASIAVFSAGVRTDRVESDARSIGIEPAEDATFGTNCSRSVVEESCDNHVKADLPAFDLDAWGEKAIDYAGCGVTDGDGTLSGRVTLRYSNLGCVLLGPQSSVTRGGTLAVIGLDGTTTLTTDEEHEDYRGEKMGGGVRVTVPLAISNPLEGRRHLQVLGLHRTVTNADGTVALDVSAQTTEKIVMKVGTPLSKKVSFDGGQLELSLNNGSVLAALNPHDLEYDLNSGCCHPKSGTVDVALTGAVEAYGLIRFDKTCGVATLEMNNNSVDIPLPSCL